MGADIQDPTLREGAAVVDGTVACPACSYDLRGLVNGERVTCPECGREHALQELIDRRAAPRWWNDVSAWWLFASFAMLSGYILLQAHGMRNGGLCVVLWPPTLIVGWTARRLMHGMLGPSLILAALACCAAFTIRSGRGEIPLSGTLVVNAIPLAIWAGWWWWPLSPSRWAAPVFLALVPGVPAVALIAVGLRKYAIGEWWTAWDDPRSGYWYTQWPLYRGDAIALGVLLLVPTVMLVVLAVLMKGDAERAPATPASEGPRT